MQILIYITLLGWIPVCLLLFVVLPPQRAVVVGVVGGWLLLPPTGIALPGLPDYNKIMAPVVGVTLATLIFQPNRLLAFRLKWFDLPALLWSSCPLVSSLANGLGVYDGLSASFGITNSWAVPYLIGRLYFGNKEGMRELAVGIAIGGIIWVVPCLFEIRMSPILLSTVYGISRFEGTRLGSWRPFVFFSTGLELGMWMTASSLTAVWLWRCGSVKHLGHYSLGTWFLPILLITTFFCRATGALVLLIAGLMILWLCTRYGSKLLFCALLLVPPVYYVIRIPNLWSGSELIGFIDNYINKERSQSLGYRIEMENLLTRKAMVQPVFGWGGWGRSLVYDEHTGRDISPTDGMWIIFLGCYGCVGLLAWTTMMLLPPWLFVLRFPVRQWRDPTVAPMAALATLIGLYVVDCLVNGFMNLSYVLACGGLIGAVSSPDTALRTKRKASHDDDRAGLHGSSVIGPDLEPVSPEPARQSLVDRYRQLARKLSTEGQLAEAKDALSYAYDLLVKLAATHPEVREIQRQRWDCANDLAWLLLNESNPTTGDPLLAVDLARQATEADAGCATYWNTLGAACYRVSESAHAITALERSMVLSDGGTAFDYVFLSLAQSQIGQQAEARLWLARTEEWIKDHGSAQPELSRLVEQARGCLAAC